MPEQGHQNVLADNETRRPGEDEDDDKDVTVDRTLDLVPNSNNPA